MGAAARFANANTKFSERLGFLLPIQKEVEIVKPDGSKETKLVYDCPANYEVKIRRCKYQTARPPKKDEWYIAEFEVLKSSNPRIAVGALRAWMQAMDNDAAGAATTDFMFAALGLDRRVASELAEIKKLDAEGVLPAMLADTLDDPTDPENCHNALEGKIVCVEVQEIITKGKGQPFNRHTWTPKK